MEAHTSIARHYGDGTDVERRIEEELRASGFVGGKELSRRDVAGLDQFHVGGAEATEELARLLAPLPGMQVLDVGSGLGGPARYLAAEFGCRVSGIDLTAAYCRVACLLSERMGLQGHVEFRQGDALQLPFSDDSFDAAWTQHASMNIADKTKFYEEIARVVKPGGRFVMYDVTQYTEGPIFLPVPWARHSDASHLATADEMREAILGAGFSLVAWNDVSKIALSRLASMISKSKTSGFPRLGLHLLMGPEFPEMTRNFQANLEQRRCAVMQGLFARVG